MQKEFSDYIPILMWNAEKYVCWEYFPLEQMSLETNLQLSTFFRVEKGTKINEEGLFSPFFVFLPDKVGTKYFYSTFNCN